MKKKSICGGVTSLFLLSTAALFQSVAVAQAPQLYVESGIHHSARSVAFSHDGKLVAAGSLDRTIKVWSLKPTRELLSLPNNKMAYYLAFHPKLPILASSNEDSTLTIWDLRRQRLIHALQCGAGLGKSFVTFSRSGTSLLCTNEIQRMIRSWNVPGDLGSFQEMEPRQIQSSHRLSNLSLNLDGTMLAGSDEKGNTRILDTSNWQVLYELNNQANAFHSVGFAPLSSAFVTLQENVGLQLWKYESGKWIAASKQKAFDGIHSVAFSSDERFLACALENGDVVVVDATTWQEINRLKSYSNRVEEAGLTEDGRHLAVQLWYNAIVAFDLQKGIPAYYPNRVSPWDKIWAEQGEIFDRNIRIENKKDSVRLVGQDDQELCRVVILDKQKSWVIVTPDGRFDTNKSLNDIEGVHWILNNDPFQPLPLEIFMRDYYEPKLLKRLLEGEELPKVRPLAELNRVQPEVKVVEVKRGSSAQWAEVTVEVVSAAGQFNQNGKTVSKESGVHDLRLFRDGQLVGQWPEPKPGGAVLSNGTNLTAAELRAWQAATRVELDVGTKKTRRTFQVRLPHNKAGKQVEFSAYAFNVDRVKSATATQEYIVPRELPPVRPRAYIVSMGVNAYENPQWDLRFAASDAVVLQEALAARLGKQYEVVPIRLISDYQKNGEVRQVTVDHGTRGALQAVLQALSGKGSKSAALAGVPNAAQLRRAAPDDLVVLTFSSHGYTDRNGLFYVVPSDSGRTDGREISAALLRQWISSDELSEWLREVDAGDLVMIVDTCHSAATFESPGFKPGPMGSRGLGQLAYDKGIRILAASQANDVALESEKIKQGLLTYALVREGLEKGQAAGRGAEKNEITLDGWLQYATERVPQLYDDIREGRFKDTGIDEQVPPGGHSSLRKPKAFQQPSLFDFRRKSHNIILAREPSMTNSHREQ